MFCWDPLEPQPHDVDIKALLRIDFLLSSPLLDQLYKPFASSDIVGATA